MLALVFASLFLYFSPRAASAAEVHAYVSIALSGTMAEVAPLYEKKSGNKLKLEITTVAALKKRLDAGEAFDVAILTPAAIDDLIKQGKVVADSKAVIVKSPLGVGIKAGAKRPDISTTDAFKKSLLAAKSFGYTDPALGGASGVYTGKLVEKLGLADALKSKSHLTKGSDPLRQGIASGEIEIGVTQISELLNGTGIDVVGPLPADIQNYTVFASGVASAAKDAAAGKDFLKYMASPEVAAIMKTKGLEPGA